jgi:ribosomal protein L40E
VNQERVMPEILCTACGAVGTPKDGACAKCGSRDVLPADAPSARKFIEAREARQGTKIDGDTPSVRAEVTGKVLGRALGKLLGK